MRGGGAGAGGGGGLDRGGGAGGFGFDLRLLLVGLVLAGWVAGRDCAGAAWRARGALTVTLTNRAGRA